MPLSGASQLNWSGSHSGSTSNWAKRGRIVSTAFSAPRDAPIAPRTSAIKVRTVGVSRTNSSTRTSLRGREMRAPVPGDRRARRYPHPVSPAHVSEEAVERARPPWPAHDPAVQANRHHPATVFVQVLERVHEVREEVVARDESVDEQELEVVRVEGVRDHELRASAGLDPVRQLVRVRV